MQIYWVSQTIEKKEDQYIRELNKFKFIDFEKVHGLANLRDKIESQHASNNIIIILERILDKDFQEYLKPKRIVKLKIVAQCIYDKNAK